MTEILRTEILRITGAAHQWSIETVRNGGFRIVVSPLAHDWRPGGPVDGIPLDLQFEEARAVAIGILRAIYHQMPQTWYLAEGDPEEYLAHILEMLYESVPASEADPRDGIKNLLTLIRHYKSALVQIGKARKRANVWQRRYEHAAMWARRNHETLVRQRKQLRKLNRSIIERSHGKRNQIHRQHESGRPSRSDSAGDGVEANVRD